MNFPQSLSAREFLARHWQKAPLAMPGAFAAELPLLSADELGWLATQEDVESRLVFTERDNGRASYRVETGPFSEEELQQLPTSDWTLLVQDIDKHLPDFRACFALVDFIPDWRIDDLMISFAAPGGSVGPHQDNYDVFLCQTSGTREWRLAARDGVPAAPQESPLLLLEEFTDRQPVIARHGDILYLPPRVPHWGIARDACMTYSIGMRAPTRTELVLALGEPAVDGGAAQDIDAERFYEDPDLDISESTPGQISERALLRCRVLLGDAVGISDQRLASALGRVVTETKPWITPACRSADEARAVAESITGPTVIPVHGMARLAWCRLPDRCLLFANGYECNIPSDRAADIIELCRTRQLGMGGTAPAQQARWSRNALLWLLRHGVLDPDAVA